MVLILVSRVDSQIFFKTKTAFINSSCLINTDVSDMPRFILITCYILFAFGISDNKAVFMAVCRYPVAFRRVSEGIVDRVQIKCQSGLVIGKART